MIDCIGNQQHVRFLLLDHQNLGFIFPFGDGDTDSQHLTTMLNVVGSLQWSQYLIHASHHFTINMIAMMNPQQTSLGQQFHIKASWREICG